jgi:hypothetical protein
MTARRFYIFEFSENESHDSWEAEPYFEVDPDEVEEYRKVYTKPIKCDNHLSDYLVETLADADSPSMKVVELLGDPEKTYLYRLRKTDVPHPYRYVLAVLE